MTEKHAWRRTSPGWALAILAAISTCGFIDRIVMNVLVEPIKTEFQLSDTQMGLLTGLAFSVLNVVLGLWVARIAERRRRLTLVAIGTVAWSIATALCGAVASFGQLALARIGVGVGEAVGLPATSSIISDYFPKEKRTSAMAVLLLAPPIGAFLGSAGGASIAQAFGWRTAFVIASIPGFILAILVALTVAEPVRGQHDQATESRDTVPPLSAVFRRIWERRTLRHLLLGSTIATLTGFGVNVFLAAFLLRRFGFSIAEAGVTAGLIASVPATISVLGAGWLSDRIAKTDVRSYGFVPAIALVIATPIYMLAVTRETPGPAIALLCVAALFQYCYLAPTSGVFQNMMHPRMRASAYAIMSISTSLIGAGLGPLLVGALSDRFSHGVPPGQGLVMALVVVSAGYCWAAMHYWRATRTLRNEWTLPL